MRYLHPELLVEPEELAGLQKRDDTRILDAAVFLFPGDGGYRAESGLARYREAHVPGAAFMDLLREFSDTSSGLGFTVPDVDSLAAAIGRLGVSHDHRVVVYSSGHMMWATRAFWLLRYAGHDDVAVLNGGLLGWHDAGGPLATGDEHYPPTVFEARPQSGWFVDVDTTRHAMEDDAICTVNALPPAVYAGTGEMHYGRRGHIPGSRNLPYDQLLDGQRLRPADELRRVLDEAGVLAAPRVISYCGGGISATLDGFACLLTGQTSVAVYDGSMAEWVRNESLPLKTGPEP